MFIPVYGRVGLVMAALVVWSSSSIAQVCILPQNGSGMVDLPPGCANGYLSPEEFHMITDGLPEGTTIRVNVRHRSFTNIVRTPGGNLDGEIEEFSSGLFITMTGTGELGPGGKLGGAIGFSDFIFLNGVPSETHTGPVFLGLKTQAVPAEMVRLEGQASPFDPKFSLLRITAGSGFNDPIAGVDLTSPGQIDLILDEPGTCAGGANDTGPCASDINCPTSTIDGICEGGDNNGLPCANGSDCPATPEDVGQCGANGICQGGDNNGFPCVSPVDCPTTPVDFGQCRNRGACICPGGLCSPEFFVDSFFDITYRIEWVGKNTSELAGLSGTSIGTVRMQTGAVPTLVMRPVGGVGREIDVTPGDSVTVEMFVKDFIPRPIGAYQFTSDVAGTPLGRTVGSVSHDGNAPVVDQTRPDFLFFGQSPTVQPFVGIFPGVVTIFIEPPPSFPVVESETYLGELTYLTSLDARGDFEIKFIAPGQSEMSQTAIIDPDFNGIQFQDFGAVLHLPPAPPCDPAVCAALGDTCNEGVCGADGNCTTTPFNEGGACNDDDLCTTGDACAGGLCSGSPRDCSAFTDACNDGICDLVQGCIASPANEGGVCDDLDPTTIDDTCTGGTCVGTPSDSTPPEIVHANVPPNPGVSTSASTCSGYIDPRIENIVINTVDTSVGPDEVVFEFSEPVFAIGGGPVTMASFAVTQTGIGTPPGIAGVVQDDPNLPIYRVQLDRIIDFKEWTTVRAMVEDAVGNAIPNLGDLGPAANEPDRIDVGRLPGDINQDGIVSPVDLVNLRQFLRSNSFHNDCDDVLYFDLNRNGALGDPQDLIRFRQIRLGSAPATQRWALQEMNFTQP